MTDQSKLENRHKSLSEKVETLESQRQYKRNFEHKSDLINLKKEKLKIKDKIHETESEEVQLELFN
tara:strand:+ start:5256 stop:5453 length:198 start_codon:yes stop_codon:yes gene_type:complete